MSNNIYFECKDNTNIVVTDSGYIENKLTNVYKGSVIAATTENITLSGTQTVDGISLSVDDRILVKDQSTSSNNGIYIVAAGAWTRAADFAADTSVTGVSIYVSGGTVNSNTMWVCTNAKRSDIVGTDNLSFSKVGEGSKDYLYGSRSSSNQLILNSSTDIVFNAENAAQGGVSLNTSTGVITLNSDRIYVLMFRLQFRDYTNETNGSINVGWVDSSNNSLADNGLRALGVPTTYSTGRTADTPYGIVLYSTYGGNDTQVKVRVISKTGNTYVRANYSSVTVYEI